MATLVLSTIGYAIGGPLGGALGSFLGQAVDQRLFAPKLQGARLPDVDVQLSSYGTVIPRLYGTLRVAGALIWSTGLVETAHSTGGKMSGGRRTQYVYSSSFAIAVSARPIRRIARIWADGKLIATHGTLLGGGRVRVYTGSERQNADPLIVAREGAQAPSYRGLAYVVFEDLPLADYANRIPNLTFEVEADVGAVALGTIVTDVARSCQVPLACSIDTSVRGFAATRGQTVGQCVDALLHMAPRASLIETQAGLELRTSAPTPFPIHPTWLGAHAAGPKQEAVPHSISPALAAPQEISISYFDADHDYQPGVQSAVLRQGLASENMELALPVVMDAQAARTLAARLYVRRLREARRMRLSLPLAGLYVQNGDIVRLPDDSLWRVDGWALEAMVVELRLHSLDSSSLPVLQAESGRKREAALISPSASVLYVFETRNWRNALAVGPELWIAVAGKQNPWRGAQVHYSSSAFAHWAQTPFLDTPSAIGYTRSPLAQAQAALWDMQQTLVVELENPTLTLASVRLDDILDGQNLAYIDEEIIAYRHATLVGKGLYRLSGLLRGLFGTQPRAHGSASRFVALDETRLFCLKLPASYIGRTLEFRPFGPGDTSETVAQTYVVRGVAMAATSPVRPVIAPPLENQSPAPPPQIIPIKPAEPVEEIQPSPQPEPPVEIIEPPVDVEQPIKIIEPPIKTEPPVEIMQPPVQPEPPVESVEPPIKTEPPVEIVQPPVQPGPPVEIIEPPIKTEPPVEIVQPPVQPEPPVEIVQPPIKTEPPVEMVQPPVQPEPPVEIVQPPIKTEPPVEIVQPPVQPEPPVESVEPPIKTEPPVEIVQPPVQPEPPVEIIESPIKTEPPVEIVQPPVQPEPPVEIVQPPIKTEPPVEIVQPPVQPEPPVEIVQPPIKTEPPVENISTPSMPSPPITISFPKEDGFLEDLPFDTWLDLNDKFRRALTPQPQETRLPMPRAPAVPPLQWRYARAWQQGFVLSWTRCSRNGYLWLDGADAPHDEPLLAFDVLVKGDIAAARWRVEGTSLFVSPTTLAAIASADATRLQLSIAQISAMVGAGPALSVDMILKETGDGGK